VEVNETLLKELMAKDMPDKLLAEKATMKSQNKGCSPSEATKMQEEKVKADGNCLFNCLTLAMEGVVNKPQETREMVVSIMMSQPDVFTEAELGKPPETYFTWLLSGSKAWGGIPELKALSTLYQVEIGVVVIQEEEILMFGHTMGYKERVYVLYDGTHYNLLVSASSKQRRFPPEDEKAFQGCLNIA